MRNKILLIRPENIYNYNNYPPLSLISVGTSLKSAGYDVKIIDCAFEQDSLKLISKELNGLLFVGITLLTSEIPDAYRIIRYIRKHSEVPIIAGGVHCTLFPEQMAACDEINYVVCGEGEEHILRIAESIKNNKKPGKIFAKDNLDLESVPCPDYGIDDNIERYINSYLTDKLWEFALKPMRWLPYESSRGCPSRCSFCINVVTDNMRYRKKSAEKVVSEVGHIVNKYSITHIKFVDDNFFVDINRVREICAGLIKNNIQITWDAECRCDYFNDKMLNDDTLGLLKKAGLIQLTIGIESGSLSTLKKMKKDILPYQSEYAVKRCNEYQIIARSSFMLEVPGENLSDIKETIRFVNQLRKYDYFTCGVTLFRPYPKCELSDKLISEGYLVQPSSFGEWSGKIISMYTSAEDIRPWQVNGKFSESACFFLNMQSAVRLGNHQIDNFLDRIINTFFILLGRFRNKLMFYLFPIDKYLYKKFLVGFYNDRGQMEKGGKRPLSKVNQYIK